MVTQRVLGSLRRFAGSNAARSWLALAFLGLLALLAWAAQPNRQASAQDGSVIKAYPCPEGQSVSIADHLREELRAVDGVRISPDSRASQVVVQAPREIQVWVAQRLAANVESKTAAAEPHVAAMAATQTRTISLRHIRADQLEAALASVLGDRLTSLSKPQEPTRAYQVALASGKLDVTLDLAADPLRGYPEVKLAGTAAAMDAGARLIQILDSPPEVSRDIRLLPLRTEHMEDVKQAMAAIQTASSTSDRRPVRISTVALNQAQPAGNVPLVPPPPTAGAPILPPGPAAPAGPQAPPAAANPPNAPVGPGAPEAPARGELVSPVQIEILEGLDVLVLRGNPQDIAQVAEIIKQVEMLSAVTQPEIRIIPLRQVDCEALALLLHGLYDEIYLPRQGRVSITPVITPNELLVVGRPENVKTVATLVEKLDQPAIPNAQYRIFQLRHAAAAAAQTAVQSFFPDRGGLAPVVRTTLDARSNTLIVQASPRDMAEVEQLIEHIDTSTKAIADEVRIIRLEHAMASDVATIMQSAIGSATGGGAVNPPGGAGAPFGPGGQPQGQAAVTNQQAAMLRLLTVDARGRRLLNSGILNNVKITTDARANALIVTAPQDDMELIEALVKQIDQIPAAEAQIKVFTIVNGDASNLTDMLRTLFGLAAAQAGPGGQAQQGIQTTTAGGENTVVSLRFGVDVRTNSVIATGTMGDLNVVEAVLTKLDDSDVRRRKSVVIRLKNSPATDVATTLNTFVTTQRQYDQSAPGLTSVYEEVEREVVIVPEPVTNSLVISATPKYFDEITGLVEKLDARPLMVAVQVLIASVELGDTNEFGIELGLQDSALFDRSILSSPVTTSTTLPTGTTTQTVIAANNSPGFNFNDTTDALGNSGLGTTLQPPSVAGQGLTNFALGRQNGTLGYGGLVLSAQSENISALLRALAENHKVEVLEKPQVTMLDNQPANVQVGQRVPTIQSVSTNALVGTTNSVTFQNVGVILGVTPRISPDGMVVMQIQVEKSELESDATGIPIFTSSTGQVIRSPIIDSTTAQSTIAAMDGQTIVLSGLITKTKNESHRSVPWLGDIPVLGNLFRYDSTTNDRTELLIILTPHVIRNTADADLLKREEAARMSWCLCDVTKIYGEAGLRARNEAWGGADVKVAYPDSPDQPLVLPGEITAPEVLPTPSGEPRGPSPRQDTMPLAPQPPVPGTPSPGNPTSAFQSNQQPVAAPPNYRQFAPAPAAEPAIYQQPLIGQRSQEATSDQMAGQYPPNGALPQPAVYQQPVGPAIYQQPVNGQPGAALPQPAIYQQPLGPAPYQPPPYR